jgi:hypothetical protein
MRKITKILIGDSIPAEIITRYLPKANQKRYRLSRPSGRWMKKRKEVLVVDFVKQVDKISKLAVSRVGPALNFGLVRCD